MNVSSRPPQEDVWEWLDLPRTWFVISQSGGGPSEWLVMALFGEMDVWL